MPKLIIQRKGKPSRVYQVEYKNTLIGRGKDTQLLLPDISVSRHHARIVNENDAFTIQDLGSQNGTTVNGQRIQSQVLKNGDEIQLGKFMLLFECREEMGTLDDYQLTARTGFLERISSLKGEAAHSTTHLSKTDLEKVRGSIRVRDLAQVQSIENPDQVWFPGENGIRFGEAGIPAKGLGSGSVVIAWDGTSHVLLKVSGLLTTVKINGRSIKRQGLQSGDTLQIGKSQYRYEVQDS